MADDEREEARVALIRALMEKINADTYPSVTMLDMVEELLRPEEVPTYAAVLRQRVRQDTYPSIPMLHRLRALL